MLDVLAKLVRDLTELRAPFALVGGLAVSVRTEPRFTRDVDVVLAVDGDDAAESLIRDLQARGWVVAMQVEHDVLGRLAMVRVTGGTHGVAADLLFASSGCEHDIVAAAEPLEILPDLVIDVATTGHLITLKLLSRGPDRPTDQADLLSLARTATGVDWGAAEALASAIAARGAARGRDLVRDVAELRDRQAG